MATFLRSRATVTLLGQGSPSLITTYWDSTGAALAALAAEAVARDRAFWIALAAEIPTGATYTPNLIVDEVEETTGELVNQVAVASPGAVTFGGTFESLPYSTQGLIRFGTNLFVGGRRVQGRRFVPGLMENRSSGTPPVPSSAVLAAMQNAANALATTLVTPIGQRVWSRPSATRAGLSTPVITRAPAPTWAVLKSRRI